MAVFRQAEQTILFSALVDMEEYHWGFLPDSGQEAILILTIGLSRIG